MKYSTRQMIIAAVFVAVTAILAQIIVILPYTPIQITMSIVGVFLCGALLDTKYSCMAMCAYILLGAFGMPVFGKFSGGLGIIAGPTGGYIVAYPFMVLVIGMAVKKFKKRFFTYFLSMIIALLICYALGTLWLMISTNMNLQAALAAGVYSFVVFDIIKAAASAGLAAVLIKRGGIFKINQ